MMASNGRRATSSRNRMLLSSVALLVLMLSMPITRVLSQSPAVASIGQACSKDTLQAGVNTATASISQAAAENEAAQPLASQSAGYDVSFNSIYYTLGWTSTCSVQLQTVN